MKTKKGFTQSDKSTVRSYKNFEDLRDCLASGWAATTVREFLVKRYGQDEVPSVKAIERWRKKHLESAARVIPHQLITRKLKGVTFKVDVIGHLSRLIALCEDRVGRGLEHEEIDGGMPISVIDGVIRTYLEAIREYVNVAQELGILSKIPLAQPTYSQSQTLVMSPEDKLHVQKTLNRIAELMEHGVDHTLDYKGNDIGMTFVPEQTP
jgi:hypothetical protein